MVTTDQASDSDMVFGIFSMLGYRFAPRFADLGDQRFWRAEPPDGSTGDYGLLDAIARNMDPLDSSYRRSLGKQLSVQESRHRLARKICHGNAGRIRQAYREGQEGQLKALGLVVNAVVLWNSRYLSAIVDQLRAQGVPVKDEDVARLSPLGHAHLNCLGRYAIASSAPDKGLRQLGMAVLPEASTASATVVDEDGV